MKEQKKFGIFKSENNKLTRINAVVIDESNIISVARRIREPFVIRYLRNYPPTVA
jgi:hypothetical protein